MTNDCNIYYCHIYVAFLTAVFFKEYLWYLNKLFNLQNNINVAIEEYRFQQGEDSSSEDYTSNIFHKSKILKNKDMKNKYACAFTPP